MANQKPKHPDSALIDKLGGTGRTAKFFKVQPPSVSAWRLGGIPGYRIDYLKLARPDLFPSVDKPRKTRKKSEQSARP